MFLGVNTLHVDVVSLNLLQFRLVSYHGAVGRVAFSSWDIHFFTESPGDCMLHCNKHKLIEGLKCHFSFQAGQTRLLCQVPISLTGLPFPLPAIELLH